MEKDKSAIVIFPEAGKLKEKIEKLRAEISALISERDELRFVVCKNIEAEYMLKVGSLEYKVYEAECTVLRLKRKAELIQARINRQEKVLIDEIDAQLDKEFEDYQQKLDSKLEEMNEALERSKGELLSPDESAELKSLYRKAVKALHPDLNPDLTEAQKTLFYNAVEAYKTGNLEALRIISEMLPGEDTGFEGESAIAKAVREKARLTEIVETLKNDIEKIKSEYPYLELEILNDEERLTEYKTQLKETLEHYKGFIESYKHKIKEMLG